MHMLQDLKRYCINLHAIRKSPHIENRKQQAGGSERFYFGSGSNNLDAQIKPTCTIQYLIIMKL